MNARDAVSKRRRASQVRPEKRARAGSANGRAKLNQEKVGMILLCLRKGVSAAFLAAVYDVSVSTIRSIARGRTWKAAQ